MKIGSLRVTKLTSGAGGHWGGRPRDMCDITHLFCCINYANILEESFNTTTVVDVNSSMTVVVDIVQCHWCKHRLYTTSVTTDKNY